MNFRTLRENAGLTQKELATAASLDQTTISQIETGKVRDLRYSTLEAIAKALETTIDAVVKAIRKTEAA